MKNNLILKRIMSFGLAMALFISTPANAWADDVNPVPVETVIDDKLQANEADAERETVSEQDLATAAKGESESTATSSDVAENDSEETPTGEVAFNGEIETEDDDKTEETDEIEDTELDEEDTELEETEDDEEVEIVDDANLVRIVAKKNVLNGAVKVSVKEITQESDEGQYNQMASVLNSENAADTSVVDFVAYDISLINENGEVVEPTGEVKVDFNNPSVDGLNDDSLSTEVYHYLDSSLNRMNEVASSTDSVEMITDHFSTYIIAIKGYRSGNIFDSKYVTVRSEQLDWKYSNSFPEMYSHEGDYANSYFYTNINGTNYRYYYPLELRVYVNGSAEPVETFSHAYFASNDVSINRDNFKINAEDYVVESVNFGVGPTYNKYGMQRQDGFGTYNIGFVNYMHTDEKKPQNDFYKNGVYNIVYPVNPQRNINYIDIYLKDSNLNVYSVQKAALIDYKDCFKAAVTNQDNQIVDAFNFARNGGINNTAGNVFEGNNFHENATVYQGLANQKYYDKFNLADSIYMTQELFPSPDMLNENYDAAAYNVSVQFVKTDDGYYVMDSGKYGYDLVQDNGDPAIGTVSNHATLKVKNEPENGFWPFALSGYHFGMQIPLDFAISPNGKTVVNGQESDTVFEFSGDDDVFVYIDENLALDLGGIHGRVAGSINFATGMVHVEGDDYIGNGNRMNLRDKDFNFYDKIGMSREVFSKSSHTMHVVYFERGANESNCMIKYNFVPLNNKKVFKKNLTIEKEWDDANNTELRPEQLKFNVCGSYSEEGNVKYVDLAGNSHDDKESAMTEVVLSADENWQKTINDIPVFFKNDTRKKISWDVEEVVPEDYEQTGYEKWYSETTDITKEDLIPEPASEGGERYSHFDIEVNAVSDDNSVGARTIESIRDLNGNENCVSVLGYYDNYTWRPYEKSVPMYKHNNYEWRADHQAIGKNTVITFYVKYSGRNDYKLVIIDKNSYYPEGAKYYKHSTEFNDQHEPYRNLALYYTKPDNPWRGYVDLSGKNLFTTAMIECPVTVSYGYGNIKNDHYGYQDPGIDLVLSPKTIESVSIEATGDEHFKFKNTVKSKVNLTFKKVVEGENVNPDSLYSIKVEKVSTDNGKEKTEIVDYKNGKVYIGNNVILNAKLTSEQRGVILGIGCQDGIYNIWADQTVSITGLPVGVYRISEVGAYGGVELNQFDVSIQYDDKTIKDVKADIECGNGDKYVEIHNKLKQTYGWKLKKVSATLNTKTLPGAKFTLTGKNLTYYGISGEDGYVGWYTSDSFSDDSLVNEIEDGKYILTEIEAPTGYAISTEKWTVEIKKYKSVSVKNGKNTIAKTDKNNPIIEVTFENEVAYTLPETGGRGTYLYTIGGILLMLVGALLLYKNKINKK